MSPRLHKREQVVNEARASLLGKVSDWLREKDTGELTDAEYLAVVADVLSSSLQSRTKMMIRMERHGNTDTPGGWA